MIAPAGGADGGDEVLLARCRERLRGVFPKPPTSVEQLLDAARDVLGHPVRLIVGNPLARAGLPSGPLPSGMWAQLECGINVVWVDGQTSRWHRLIVAAHEFGHIFLGHSPSPPDAAAQRDALLDDLLSDEQIARSGLSGALIASMMGRCGAPTPAGSPDWLIEREAEIAGRFLAQRLMSRPGRLRPLGL